MKTEIVLFCIFIIVLTAFGGYTIGKVDTKKLLRSTYGRAYHEGTATGVKLVKDTNSTIVDFRESFYTDSINFEKLIK